MSHLASHPHHVSQLLGPALERIVHALADRGEQITDAEYEARAAEAWTLIESFQPRDPIDLILTGQFITMNELFADTSKDILRGMPDSLKQRARSSAVAMGRLALAQAGELERRGIQPYQTEAVPEQRPAAVANTPTAEPAETPQPAVTFGPAPLPATKPERTPSKTPPPAEERSWVDEPYQELLEATPAMLAAAPTMVSTKNIPPPVTHEDNGRADAPSAFELPHLPTEYSRAEAMAAAAD